MIHIIYNNFLLPNGNGMSTGGIQTYLQNLIEILDELHLPVCIHQRAEIDFEKEYRGHKVYGYKIIRDANENKHLLKRTLTNVSREKDAIIFACESCAVFNPKVPAIAIQHGISWDKPDDKNANGWRAKAIFLRKVFATIRISSRLNWLDHTICVDYNFVNWYKAQVAKPKCQFTVIPNFTEVLPLKPIKSNDIINIVFARRFFPYRGTRIFAQAINSILKEYPSVRVTVAGSGPDENFLREQLKNDNVQFIRYEAADSISIHKDKHIAIVPTTGSEGTSLSLLEAMGCGCAPVCTYVGGMSNIILDGFNGLMISPSAEELYLAIKRLLDNPLLMKTISQNAYDTAKISFNKTRWREKWIALIKDWVKGTNNE